LATISNERPLVLSRPLLDEMVDHLRMALPDEGCGLVAEAFESGEWSSCRFFPGDNIDHSPHRFTMDPRAVVDALRTIDDNGWRLGAIVHSHPTGTATPSPTDLAEVYYPEAAMLIVGLEDPVFNVRAWRLSPELEATEVAVVVFEPTADTVAAGAATA
jgi:proteasome lid subunit RPN8/RPN11